MSKDDVVEDEVACDGAKLMLLSFTCMVCCWASVLFCGCCALLDLIGIDEAITDCFCWLDCAWTASVRLSKGVGTGLELKILNN